MSSPNTTHIRPRTSKPRGICKYYTTPRGCFAGSACKFLHADPQRQDPEVSQPLLTPYDQSKRCKYYANGFCRRGDDCWFKHTVDSQKNLRETVPRSEDAQDEPCSICFEKPVTYGLLSGCSHIFCITCIRQWRDQKGQIEQGNMKKCPMCREPSRFITPSSRFWKHGHPERVRVTNAYKESMAKVPCRYFQRSLRKNKTQLLCPFGKDCFYQHTNLDGTPHEFQNGADVCMRTYYNAMRPSMRSLFDDFMEFTADFVPTSVIGHDGSGILSMEITADMDAMNELTNSSNSDRRSINQHENTHIRRQLSLLREAMDSLESAVSASNDSVAHTLGMVRLLMQQSTHTSTESGNSTETVMERIFGSHQFEDRDGNPNSQSSVDGIPSSSGSTNPGSLHPNGNWTRIRDDEDDMPELQSVSNSSLSEASLSDSDSESDDDVSRLGMYLRAAENNRFNTMVDLPENEEDSGEEIRMMQEIAERGPEEVSEETVTLDAVLDEPQIPIMDYENPAVDEGEEDSGRVVNPPFLTDGRGRVVWSSNGEAMEMGSRPTLITTGEVRQKIEDSIASKK